ncbi:MAG TPA: hypothetical protein VK070_14420 [Acidimicrobiia bacterium]|mgnify:CR=1 FL=1|nr:hypothetical protein [Acidimicrobiia bacterium]
MTKEPSHHSELQFLEQLVDQYAFVAGDVLAVDPVSWAIHGLVPRDGEILMARFDRPEDARDVLAGLKPNLVMPSHLTLTDASLGSHGEPGDTTMP